MAFCRKCGAYLSDDVRFCGTCGAPNDANSRTQGVSEALPKTSGQVQANTAHKRLTIIAICMAALLVICVIGGAVLHKNKQAAYKKHAVALAVQAPAWTDQCTRIPIVVTGSDASGASVNSICFVDGNGVGLELAQGSYTLTFPASPLMANGSMYADNTESLPVVVDANLSEGEQVDANDKAVVFSVADSLGITDEQIERAAEYANKDTSEGASAKVSSLKETVTIARDNAVAAADAEASVSSNQSQGAATGTGTSSRETNSEKYYSNKYFSLDLANDDSHIVSVKESTKNGNPVYYFSLTLDETQSNGSPYAGAGADYEYTVDLNGSITPATRSYSYPQLAGTSSYDPNITVNEGYTVYITNAAG